MAVLEYVGFLVTKIDDDEKIIIDQIQLALDFQMIFLGESLNLILIFTRSQ